jgi:CubicO group peptidase (beta-lactamase class C family)
MTALTIKTAPNMEFHYSSANTQLLALIIERIIINQFQIT